MGGFFYGRIIATATHMQPTNKKAPTIYLQVPVIIGVPETIRTSGPFLRREVLYPAELRGLMTIGAKWYNRDAPRVQPILLEMHQREYLVLR